jgi:hypothetical protein
MNTKILFRWLLVPILAGIFIEPLAAQTAKAPQPTICTRSCWSARDGTCTTTMSALTRAIIHHTASSGDWSTTSLSDSAARMRSHQNYHMDSNGWCDLGYHFTVDKLGNIFEGRKGSMTSLIRGTHAGCGNTDTFGFTFLGYFHSPYNHVPPVSMRNAMYSVIAWRMPAGWSPYGGRTSYSGSLNGTAAPVDTHRWVGANPGSGCVYTSCPGDNIATKYGMGSFNSGEFRRSIAVMRWEPVGANSNNRFVDNSSSGFTASSNWASSTSTSGYYGEDYRVRATFEGSDVAKWTANMAVAGNYHVYARWTAHSNRDDTAGYYVDHMGTYTRVDVNQQKNGGMYQFLGTYNLDSGVNTIRLSCWSATGQYVVADAVKWVKE